MRKKNANRIISTLAAMVFFVASTASASVLGTQNGGWQSDMGGGAVYINSSYTSESGNQTENYVEYTPNSEAVPVVINGASVYGSRTISSAVEYMQNNSLRPLIGINGDYFSLKTGIPMGYTVIDGQIFSKESGMQDAVGFRADGTGFIDKIGIDASLSHNDTKINIQYINKWPQKGFSWIYMLDSNFSDTTKTDFNAIYVTCSRESGDMSLNSEMVLRVDDIKISDSAIKIPNGKYVFVMDVNGQAEYFDMLSRLAVGDTVVFRNSVYGAERNDWTSASHIMSSIGGRLLNNGVVGSGFSAGTAPRTAVGVKDNGNIIFYTIDGRQSGYSKGVTIASLAKRMQELGCVDAINLDGGGSTIIGGIFPGTDSFLVTNRPSDGRERRCANYIFLQDLREKTGIVWYVDWREIDNYKFLAGTGYQLEALKVYDTGNYKMDGLSGVTYSIQNSEAAQSEVSDTGFVTFRGTGAVKVSVTSESYYKDFDFEVYETPDEICVIDETTGKEVTELTVDEGTMTNFSLEAGAYVGGTRLSAYPSLFKWEIIGTLAEVDEDGTVSVQDDGTKTALLRVSAGGTVKEIPINTVKQSAFEDVRSHWAKDTIEKMAQSGIIDGFNENGVRLFKPDEKITRVQFAAMTVKALGISAEDYSNTKLEFSDADTIQPWALDYVKAVTALGYITGRSDDDGKTVYFDPENRITRAEAFTIISRIIGLQSNRTLTFTDTNDIPKWAVGAVSGLEERGIVKGFEDNTIRPNNHITRAESAVLIDKSGI